MVVGRVEIVKREAHLFEVVGRSRSAVVRRRACLKSRHQCRKRDRHRGRRVERRDRLARDEPDPGVIDDQRVDRGEEKRTQIIGVGYQLGIERRRRARDPLVQDGRYRQ